jgi:hypothetical protein
VFKATQKKKKKSDEGSGREFQDWWTKRYGVISKQNKALCAMCSESVVCRTSSVKRHYESNHKWLLDKSEDEQKEYISRQVKNANLQSGSFVKFVKSTSNLVSASFEVSKIIARHGKPFSDGDYIKESWLECAPYLFEDFQNKDKILQRIKDLPISRNTVKERIINLNSNIENQLKEDIKLCQAFSICLDESTDVTSSARLAIIARYPKNNEMREELIKLANLSGTTTGAEICQKVVEELKNADLDVNKIVSVTTDGAPSMTGKDAGFVNLFTKHVGHPLVAFHCIVHQEALCAKSILKELEDVMKIVTEIVNFITARALNKRKFELLLNEVQSVYSGLLMYNSVRWLSRGRVLERFVECLDEIRMFMDDNKQKYLELTDVDWLSRLMFFTDFTLHLNELNTKLQGFGKTVDEAFDIITAFEKKLTIFKHDLEKREFQYFQRIKKFYTEIEIHETVVKEAQILLFLQTIDTTLEQFSVRFVQFRKFEDTTKFIKYPDIVDFENLDLTMFDWMELQAFEMQLVELQSSSIWKQKFVDLRVRLEIIERDRCNGLEPQLSAENVVLSVWNDLPETFNSLKKVAVAILSIFSSSYSCESLFSTMNFIKSDIRNSLTDDLSAACVALKNTKYSPDIKLLSSAIQQQKSH